MQRATVNFGQEVKKNTDLHENTQSLNESNGTLSLHMYPTITCYLSMFFNPFLNSKEVDWFWFRPWPTMKEIMCVKSSQGVPYKFHSLCSKKNVPFLMPLTTDRLVQPINWHFVLLSRASHERTVKSHFRRPLLLWNARVVMHLI